MCYAGGPYCDRNVKPRLDKAKKAFIEERTPENLQALKEVQFEYDSTPKGQKLLKEKMSTLSDKDDDGSQLIALGERLEKAETRRAQDMRDYNRRQAKKKAEKLKKKPFKLAPNIEDLKSLESEQFDMGSRLTIQDVNPGTVIHEAKVPRDFSYYSLDYDYDYDSAEDCDCDYIHRCKKINNFTIKSVDKDDMMGDIRGYNDLSDEQKEELSNIYEQSGAFETDNYEVDIYNSYYGEEFNINFNNIEELQKNLELYSLSSPNYQDKEGILGQMRQKGIDTKYKTPYSAVKEYITKNYDGKTPRYFNKNTKVEIENLKIDKVHLPGKGAKKFDTDLAKGQVPIVRAVDDGTYYAVNGFNNIEKIKNNPKRKTSQFIVIS